MYTHVFYCYQMRRSRSVPSFVRALLSCAGGVAGRGVTSRGCATKSSVVASSHGAASTAVSRPEPAGSASRTCSASTLQSWRQKCVRFSAERPTVSYSQVLVTVLRGRRFGAGARCWLADRGVWHAEPKGRQDGGGGQHQRAAARQRAAVLQHKAGAGHRRAAVHFQREDLPPPRPSIAWTAGP